MRHAKFRYFEFIFKLPLSIGSSSTNHFISVMTIVFGTGMQYKCRTRFNRSARTCNTKPLYKSQIGYGLTYIQLSCLRLLWGHFVHVARLLYAVPTRMQLVMKAYICILSNTLWYGIKIWSSTAVSGLDKTQNLTATWNWLWGQTHRLYTNWFFNSTSYPFRYNCEQKTLAKYVICMGCAILGVLCYWELGKPR